MAIKFVLRNVNGFSFFLLLRVLLALRFCFICSLRWKKSASSFFFCCLVPAQCPSRGVACGERSQRGQHGSPSCFKPIGFDRPLASTPK